MTDTSATLDVLVEVLDEREAQDAKWGEQNHRDGTAPWYRTEADKRRSLCQAAARAGACTWKHILLEEVFEALAETDDARLRAELVQVAAVAVQWVEAIDRRQP